MVQSMKELGATISKTATGLKPGRMAVGMKVTTKKVRSTDRVAICGLMAAYTTGNGTKTKLVALAHTSGLMAVSMKALG
jgi:hypothetical protein